MAGEVQLFLFVAGAAFREIWNDRKCLRRARKVTSLARRVVE